MHYVIKCRPCGRVIAQCRCPSPTKTVQWQDGPCGECAPKFMTEDEKRRQEVMDDFAKSRSAKTKPLHPKEPPCPTKPSDPPSPGPAKSM